MTMFTAFPLDTIMILVEFKMYDSKVYSENDKFWSQTKVTW